jgi:hypothetical protein
MTTLSYLKTVAASALFIFAAVNGRADVVTLGAQADTYLRDATVRGALSFMDVRGGTIDFRGYLRFDLSTIPAGAMINSATLQLTQVSGASRNDAIVAARFSLYGLDNVAGNTPQTWDEATFVIGSKGSEDVTTLAGVTDLDDNVTGITETFVGASPATKVTVTGSPLASFLATRFGDGGLATFILSNDDATDRGFGLGTKENVDLTARPALTIDFTPTAVPEVHAWALVGLAGVVAVLSKRRKTK